jgi:hypothetical protein
MGSKCCWLKAVIGNFVAEPNCTAGHMADSPRGTPATRVGEPGPLIGNNDPVLQGKRSVLIIGDSISIGQIETVSTILGDKYVVQHGPAATGGGALDVKHGVANLQEFMYTADMQPVSFDAVSFNFGVHDADYSCSEPFKGLACMPDEYTPLNKYTALLGEMKTQLLKLVPSPDRLIFALSTPICYNLTLNSRIEAFNHAAKGVMAAAPVVAVHDAYSLVTGMCGQPPYNAPYYPGIDIYRLDTSL